MFFFLLFFRQLYLDIKKQIEEIDESKKEQVGVTFHFIFVIIWNECSPHEITGEENWPMQGRIKLTCPDTVFNNGAERCSFLLADVPWI